MTGSQAPHLQDALPHWDALRRLVLKSLPFKTFSSGRSATLARIRDTSVRAHSLAAPPGSAVSSENPVFSAMPTLAGMARIMLYGETRVDLN
jgi:hypothetical protein